MHCRCRRPRTSRWLPGLTVLDTFRATDRTGPTSTAWNSRSDQRKLCIRYSSLRENDMALRHSCQQQVSTTRQHQPPGH